MSAPLGNLDGIRLGPFRTERLREPINDRFSKSFLDYLNQDVMPLLEGRVKHVEGMLSSHYDQHQFDFLPEVKYRYYYSIRLFSAGGTEVAWGEVDYDPSTVRWTPSRIKPPGVYTLKEDRQAIAEWKAWLQSQIHKNPCPENCPRCDSPHVARILYGISYQPQLLARYFESEPICNGGWPDETWGPNWRCLSCDYKWGGTAHAEFFDFSPHWKRWPL